MNLNDVQTLAISLMIDNGLKAPENNWVLTWNKAVRRGGYCDQYNKVISLSKPLMELYTQSDVRDVILHEIAHALTNPEAAAHGKEWKANALALGCNGETVVGRNSPRPKGNWVGECPNGHLYYMFRPPRKVKTCTICNRADASYVLEWTYKGMKVEMNEAYRKALSVIRYNSEYRFSVSGGTRINGNLYRIAERSR